MAELMAIRPIDANKALEAQSEDECTEEAIKECMRLVLDAPTVDAVTVVRCKDCKHLHRWFVANSGDECFMCSGRYGFPSVDLMDYCSNGERKGGEADE